MTRFHFRHPIYRPVPRDSLPRSAAGLCEWLVQLAGSLFQARPAAPVAAPGWFPSPLSNRASILPVTLLFFFTIAAGRGLVAAAGGMLRARQQQGTTTRRPGSGGGGIRSFRNPNDGMDPDLCVQQCWLVPRGIGDGVALGTEHTVTHAHIGR